MSLLEKVNVTTGIGFQMGMCVGNTGPAALVGFPSLCLQDGPLGVRFADHITATPAGITVGATWNKELAYKRGMLIGLEAKSKGVHVMLGPSVGPIGRLPAGGRNWEGFGVDPVLQGQMAAATIRGTQEQGVIATIKHFIGNEQEHFRQSFEWGLPNAISSNIDDRALHELYAWPFADAIRAGVASLMCSYNQVNNSYACQNSKLMNGILKDELGFQGFVQSDWLAQRSGVASALAGLDMSMPGDGLYWADGNSLWGPHMTTAALNSSLPLSRLDDMVTRIVAAWYQLGQDQWESEPPNGTGGPNFSSWTNEETGLLHPASDDKTVGVVNKFVDASNTGSFSHKALVRRIAAEGIVLLKNDNDLLPLSNNGTSQSAASRTEKQFQRKVRIAIIGEDAMPADGGPNTCVDRGCNKGTLGSGWGSGAVDFPYLVSPVDALKQAFGDRVELTVLPLNGMNNLLPTGNQDVCIVFANADGGEGYISSGGIKGDRNDLKLNNGGDELISAVASRCGQALGTDVTHSGRANTIAVIHSIGTVIMETFIEHPNLASVLMAHLPGQESGNALVDVLFGMINPSGHLPYTIGKSLDDYGPTAVVDYYPTGVVPQQNFSEGLLVDYRYFDAAAVAPRFEFGFGLSYTTFTLSNMVIASTFNTTRPDTLPAPRPENELSAPRYTSTLPHPSEALFPIGWRRLTKYVYPYITSISDIHPAPSPPLQDPTFTRSAAGGGEGGNPSLYDILATVSITVTNTGARDGAAVPQLYISFPANVYDVHPSTGTGRGDRVDFPPRVLRAFEKVALHGIVSSSTAQQAAEVGESKAVTWDLTRRDLSYWSVVRQNWVFPDGAFTVEAGFSSRDIRERRKLF